MPLAGLQRYQIMESLGAGAQGQTFRAIDRETGHSVAVKVLRLRNLGSDWKPYDLFERECQVLRDLKHPAIPHYLDQFASEATGEFFLVMELIEGEPLSRRFGRAGLSEPELRALLLQALDILEYLHDRQPPVIHRDIKPSNLIVRPNHASPLALIDFGGVRLALNPEGGSTMIGTFGYMAPEQLHGEATPATDIYALGATLAALAAGTPADRLPRKGLAIDLPAVLPPSPLRDVLAAMLAPDPGQRLQRAADVRRLLARTAPDPRDRSRGPGPFGQPRPPPREDLAPAPPRELARPSGLPRPLQFVVWIWSLMAGGMFFVVEHIFIPMAFALAGLHPRYTKARRRKRLAARQTAALVAVRHVRKRIEVIGRRHDPNRRSLPAADDDDD